MRILKVLGYLVLMLAMLAPTLSAQTIAVGSWKAVFVGPKEHRPKMVSAVTFSVNAGAQGFAVTARTLPNWPGELDISDVKLEGDRLSFTGIGKVGWTENGEPHCCPKLVFAGTIQGDEMKLTMTWTTTESWNRSSPHEYSMEAKRLSR